MRALYAILFSLFLISCASQIMQGYVGKTLVEPVTEYGPPIHSFEIDKET